MATVNEQLNIPILRTGETMYQPALYGGAVDEVTSDHKALVLGTAYYRNANGASWSGCNSCGGFSGANGWSNAYGITYPNYNYPLCLGKNAHYCRECKDDCKDAKNLKWTKGGRECFIPCFEAKVLNQQAYKEETGMTVPTANYGKPNIQSPTDNKGTGSGSGSGNDLGGTSLNGMSTNTKVILGVGALAVVGILVFALRRK